jgi:hypothetical protein
VFRRAEVPGGNFVVMTRESGNDLNDSFALAGADGNLSIHEAIFVTIYRSYRRSEGT